MKNFKKFNDDKLTEGKYTISDEELDNMDFIDASSMRNVIKIVNKEPQSGWWVNLTSEFGDVWHKVETIKINEENLKFSYIIYWEHRKLNYAKESTTQLSNMIYLNNVSDIQQTLPPIARVVYDENGQKYINK